MTIDTGDLDLGRYREYLRLLARRYLSPELRGRIDSSDVVQEAILKAIESRDQFRGQTEAELVAWLGQITMNCLRNTLRDFKRDKRDVTREQSIQEALDQSSARVDDWLAAEQSSPSEAAQKREAIDRVLWALAQLPEAQREAIVLDNWDNCTNKQIAERMGRTPASVAGLLRRGYGQLRQILNAEGDSDE